LYRGETALRGGDGESSVPAMSTMKAKKKRENLGRTTKWLVSPVGNTVNWSVWKSYEDRYEENRQAFNGRTMENIPGGYLFRSTREMAPIFKTWGPDDIRVFRYTRKGYNYIEWGRPTMKRFCKKAA
jgi:hypothetical protein